MRTNGVASRRLILDAATEIASERGYSGTSIGAISRRSGLPNSSIYWHFENKEMLFRAALDESYVRWNERSRDIGSRSTGSSYGRLVARFRPVPDFIRIGLALTLERPSVGADAALHRYTELRSTTVAALRAALRDDHPLLTRSQAHALAAMTMSLVDGAVIADLHSEHSPTTTVLTSAIETIALSMVSGSVRDPQR